MKARVCVDIKSVKDEVTGKRYVEGCVTVTADNSDKAERFFDFFQAEVENNNDLGITFCGCPSKEEDEKKGNSSYIDLAVVEITYGDAERVMAEMREVFNKCKKEMDV